MAALAGWLQQIVAVVLLASLVDLLLPNRTMQRYVRLVAGLLVLMTVATPLLHWFKHDFGSELSLGLDSASLQPSADPAALERIRENAARLSAARDEQAAQLAADRLGAQIKAAVEQSGAGEARKVDVRTEAAPGGGRQVSGVTIWLAEDGKDAGPSGGSPDVGREIEPVAPVVIDIESELEAGPMAPDGSSAGGQADEAAGGGEDGAQPADARPADDETASRVTALVASQFGLAPASIRVVLDADGAGAG